MPEEAEKSAELAIRCRFTAEVNGFAQTVLCHLLVAEGVKKNRDADGDNWRGDSGREIDADALTREAYRIADSFMAEADRRMAKASGRPRLTSD
ncbi:MAG: hypothetical protein KIT75_03450 [Planctomycetota bacterium]|nr:hypothetical protein [Planctomycetota bacterium]